MDPLTRSRSPDRCKLNERRGRWPQACRSASPPVDAVFDRVANRSTNLRPPVDIRAKADQLVAVAPWRNLRRVRSLIVGRLSCASASVRPGRTAGHGYRLLHACYRLPSYRLPSLGRPMDCLPLLVMRAPCRCRKTMNVSIVCMADAGTSPRRMFPHGSSTILLHQRELICGRSRSAPA